MCEICVRTQKGQFWFEPNPKVQTLRNAAFHFDCALVDGSSLDGSEYRKEDGPRRVVVSSGNLKSSAVGLEQIRIIQWRVSNVSGRNGHGQFVPPISVAQGR